MVISSHLRKTATNRYSSNRSKKCRKLCIYYLQRKQSTNVLNSSKYRQDFKENSANLPRSNY